MFMHKGEEKEILIITLGATHYKLEITDQMFLIYFSTLGANSEQQYIHSSSDADYKKLPHIFQAMDATSNT